MGYETRITLGEQGMVNILDPLTGGVSECKPELKNSRASFEYFFEPCGSLLIQVHPSRIPADRFESACIDGTRAVSAYNSGRDCIIKTWYTGRENHVLSIPLSGIWNLDVAEGNTLVLDYCMYDLDGKGYSARIPCIQAYDFIKNGKTDHGNFRLKYSFTVEGWNGSGGQLVMERPEDFHIALNGKPLKFKDIGYWKDISFRRTAIGGYIVQGENTVEMTYCGNGKAEVEAIYIIGGFKVKMQNHRTFSLIPCGTPSFEKNAAEEGYPFYAGKLRISEEVNIDAKNIIRCLARFDEINATAATVRINGQKAGDIIWGPYEIDITRYVHTGKNRIEIEMVNSLHNLLGPHHDVRGEVLPFAGPGQFDDRDNWTDAYYFRPFGVSGAVLWLSEDAVI